MLNFVYSFRVGLLLILFLLLVATLSVQYYFNLQAEQHVTHTVAEQEEALAAGVSLGFKAVSKIEYLYVLRERAKQPLLDEHTSPVRNILVVDNNYQVVDSLDTRYNPVTQSDGTIKRFRLQDVPLPPNINADQLPDDLAAQLPQTYNATKLHAGEPRAFSFSVETEKGTWYVIVALGQASAPSGFLSLQAARPLLYTFVVLLLATLIAFYLVWRFTRPIADLSDAARRVAAGDFNFRVPAATRRDEMGALAARFNDMIAKLSHTRELEARLNQAERSAVVGRLASAIAHEIKNPLNYINLTLDHLRTKLAPEDETKRRTFNRLADQLKQEVARINTRINEFLNYTRPPKLNLQPLDLRAVAEDALRIIEVQANENNITTRLEAADTLPRVNGDAEALRSVLTNLIINGLQAIDGNGGTLTVKLAPDDEAPTARVRVEVTDTGRGIPPEHISQVFEPYFSTKETGTGLGLAIVKKAVDDHHGAIAVRSKPGDGTTFTITLPTASDK